MMFPSKEKNSQLLPVIGKCLAVIPATCPLESDGPEEPAELPVETEFDIDALAGVVAGC